MGFAGACQSAPLFHCFTDNGSARHNCAQGAPANNAPNPPYSAHQSAQINFTHTAGCTYHSSQNTMHNLQFTMQTPQCNGYICALHKAGPPSSCLIPSSCSSCCCSGNHKPHAAHPLQVPYLPGGVPHTHTYTQSTSHTSTQTTSHTSCNSTT